MGGRRVGVEMKRFDVYLITLNPTRGHELNKTRPCVIISPDVMNSQISTVIVAPMTSKGRPYPTRVACAFQGIKGQVVLDQIRSVDKVRLVKKMGVLSPSARSQILNTLAELFAP